MTGDSSAAAAWAAAFGAIGGAALGGLISYLVTHRTIRASEEEGSRQRDAEAEQRTLDREHELALAREERDQERRLDTAVSVMSNVSSAVNWAHWRFLAVQRGGPPHPEPPLDDADPAGQALAILILTEGASASLLEFRRVFGAFVGIALGVEQGGVAMNNLIDVHSDLVAKADILTGQLRLALAPPER